MDRISRIEIGYLSRPQGLRGELRVRLHNVASELLREMSQVRLELPGGRGSSRVALESVRKVGTHLVVSIEGVGDRTTAEALVGARVLVPVEALPVLESDEYYHFELVGLKAIGPGGCELGRLEEVIETGAHDIYVVRGEKVGEILVPAIEAFVGAIDRRAGTILLKDWQALTVDTTGQQNAF